MASLALLLLLVQTTSSLPEVIKLGELREVVRLRLRLWGVSQSVADRHFLPVSGEERER